MPHSSPESSAGQNTDINNLKKAVTLHDIGKIGIPDQIWNKPTKLTDDEYALVMEHTVIGAGILHDIKWIDHLAEIVRSHHERYDGFRLSGRSCRRRNSDPRTDCSHRRQL